MTKYVNYINLFILTYLKSTCCEFKDDAPILIWWTPFSGEYRKIRLCSKGSCIFTEDRSQINNSRTEAFMFYGSDFTVSDIPLPRKSNHLWSLLHEESPKNQPLFNHDEVLSLFNLTSTFSQFSDMPLTLHYLKNINVLTSHHYFESTDAKNDYISKDNLAPVMYMQSDCNSPSERDTYVSELQKYISIDSYGKCLNNRELPSYLIGIEAINHQDLKKLIAKYKFVISFENYACDDYITEKLWRPMEVGSIPIYWGSPTVSEWIPNKDSIIHVRDFKSPKALAAYLHSLLKDDSLYEKHLSHKLLKVVENSKLRLHLDRRQYGIDDDQFTKGTFVEHFECVVCDEILKNKEINYIGSKVANKLHYGCSPPETVLSGKVNKESDWTSQWFTSKVEAGVLSEMMKLERKFTIEEYHTKLLEALQNDRDGYLEHIEL